MVIHPKVGEGIKIAHGGLLLGFKYFEIQSVSQAKN
ncbi:hypothetical protein SPLC1_S100030 [Arthrospira platensis C1]|nr:hypothetical protein SPLC1_S100030 [Arthrospira platensis C1]